MKCKNCRGTGERHTINWETGKVHIVQGEKCPVCGGKGDIEQTNEEWFCKLPLTEKSEFMAKAFESLLDDIENGKDVSFVKTVAFWDYWLNKEHKEL